MPILVTLLTWLVAGVCLLVWWHIADRLFAVAAQIRDRARTRQEPPRSEFHPSEGV